MISSWELTNIYIISHFCMKSQYQPELSIVVVHHRTPEVLRLCLKSLTEARLSGQKNNYEIVVVDSMSSRQSRDVAKEFNGVKILPFDYNLGFSRGVNIGLRETNGEHILILNPDVVITSGAIEIMLEYMKTHSDIGMLGPRVLNFNGTHQQTYFSYYKPVTILARRTLLGNLGCYKKVLDDFMMADMNPEEIQTPDWLMGSAIMVSREAVERVGLMDERFFMYFEDVDWSRRFWHNGYKVVYYPNAVVYHYHQRESKSRLGLLDAVFNKKTRWHIASAIKFFWKYKNLMALEIQKAKSEIQDNI